MAKRKISNAECWQCEERDVKITRLRAENAELLAGLKVCYLGLPRRLNDALFLENIQFLIAKHEKKEG